jgi:1,4-dihydroxy-2-naphthoyl-CoA hydrolase
MTQPPPTGIPPSFEPVVALDTSFDAVYGLELLDAGQAGDGIMRGRVRIDDRHLQQFGLLHGGLIAAMAEALASRGTWMGVHDAKKTVMGLSNATEFLRPIRSGHLNQTADARHRGRTRWLWEVRSTDDQGRLCAITSVNIAVRDRPMP